MTGGEEDDRGATLAVVAGDDQARRRPGIAIGEGDGRCRGEARELLLRDGDGHRFRRRRRRGGPTGLRLPGKAEHCGDLRGRPWRGGELNPCVHGGKEEGQPEACGRLVGAEVEEARRLALAGGEGRRGGGRRWGEVTNEEE